MESMKRTLSLLILSLLILTCSRDFGTKVSGNTAITPHILWKTAAGQPYPDAVDSVRITISSPDLQSSLIKTFAFGDKQGFFTKLASGISITVTVQGIDRLGNVTWRGSIGPVEVTGVVFDITIEAGMVTPTAPSQLVAQALSHTSIRLIWKENSTNEMYYLIQRQTNGSSAWDSIGVSTQNMFTDSSLSPVTKYHYKVTAANGAGRSMTTPPASATTLLRPYGPIVGGMRLIEGGTFQMGQSGISEPVHSVTLSAFYIDTTEVTQADYLSLMGVNPSWGTGDLKKPVESLTWFDAVLYCNARSKLEGKDTVYTYTGVSGTPGAGCSGLTALAIDLSKNGCRLPTEAEWEYACRGGTTTTYWWGADTIGMGDRAWTPNNGGSGTHTVATKLANVYGLYDMTGNVWEYCNDWYTGYTAGAVTDPAGPVTTGATRVLRGGSTMDDSDDVRSANRSSVSPANRIHIFGFRAVSPTGTRAATPTVPGSPTVSSATAGDGLVTVSWGSVSGATSYKLYHKAGATVDSATGTKATGVTSPKIVTGLINGTQYAFAVSAVNGVGEGIMSAVATAIPEAPGSGSWIVTGATLTDPDNNIYTTVTIGNQVWTVENLKTTKYNDGSAISYVPDSTAWDNLITSDSTVGAYCYYENSAANGAKYGALYNWYAVNTGKLAPVGWHVPTKAEWDTLQNYLIANGYNWDGSTTENKIAKSLAAKTDWASCNTVGTPGNDPDSNNRSGFSALPGGERKDNGRFFSQSIVCSWWSATESGASHTYYRSLLCFVEVLNKIDYDGILDYGFYVRLVRD
jgi:sulfatase modifying factor 1